MWIICSCSKHMLSAYSEVEWAGLATHNMLHITMNQLCIDSFLNSPNFCLFYDVILVLRVTIQSVSNILFFLISSYPTLKILAEKNPDIPIYVGDTSMPVFCKLEQSGVKFNNINVLKFGIWFTVREMNLY